MRKTSKNFPIREIKIAIRHLMIALPLSLFISCGMGTLHVNGIGPSTPESGGGIFEDPATRTLPNDTAVVATMIMHSDVYVARIKSDPLVYNSPAQSDVFDMSDSFHELNLRIVEQLLETTP